MLHDFFEKSKKTDLDFLYKTDLSPILNPDISNYKLNPSIFNEKHDYHFINIDFKDLLKPLETINYSPHLDIVLI